MSSSKRDKGEDTRFAQINKASVLSEAKEFNKPQINTTECRKIIAKIFYLLYNGEKLTPSEATELFFSITKLFRSKNASLRRMVYVLIRELAGTAQDVIIAVSSLTKDINLQQDDLRAQAIRALCKIIDHSMIQLVERFIRQGIVDSEPTVAVASLVSAYQLYPQGQEIINRWSGEIQESVSGKNGTHTSYYGLGLLYEMRKRDPVAQLKLLNSNITMSNLSPLCLCMMARCIYEMFTKHNITNEGLLNSLKWMLSSKDDMVSYEAARVICSIPNINEDIRSSAISTLQSMLTSPNPVLIFGALRTLELVSKHSPELVSCFKLSLEGLINHSNTNISTLAITTIIESGAEFDVEYLIKQASKLLTEAPDEFKVRIIKAIRSSASLVKSENSKIASFMEEALRESGGYMYKNEIIETMRYIADTHPEAPTTYLNILSEYVEDCDFPTLAISAICFIETYGKTLPNLTQYIRCLYNRFSLEDLSVRAASVSAIAGFAQVNEDTKNKVMGLLKKCLGDPDGEVRDRASFYLEMLRNYDKVKDIINYDYVYNWDDLENRMLEYIKNKEYETTRPDFSSLQRITKEEDLSGKYDTPSSPKAMGVATPDEGSPKSYNASVQGQAGFKTTLDSIYDIVKVIPSSSGDDLRILRSSDSVYLSDKGAEFVVSCMKHMLPNFIVFQFECKNTLDSLVLSNVRIVSKCIPSKSGRELHMKSESCIKQLLPGQVSCYYSAFERSKDAKYCKATFTNVMLYKSDDTTSDDNAFDEYALDELNISMSDYIIPSSLDSSEHDSLWESIGKHCQSIEIVTLQDIKDLKEVEDHLVELFNMHKCVEKPQKIDDTPKRTLKLSGVSLYSDPVLMVVMLIRDSKNNFHTEIIVRSVDSDLRSAICEALL